MFAGDRAPGQQPGLLERDAVVLVDAGAARRACRRPRACRRCGWSRSAIRRSSVDLPQPDGPMSETNSPAATVEVDAVERDDVARLGGEDLADARRAHRDGRRGRSCDRPVSTVMRSPLLVGSPSAAGRAARPSRRRPARGRSRRRSGPTAAAGSLDACPASWMSRRPMPPRRPIDTSATTAPTTALAAASRSAGSRYGTAAGQPQPQQRRPVAGGVGAHQLECGCGRATAARAARRRRPGRTRGTTR